MSSSNYPVLDTELLSFHHGQIIRIATYAILTTSAVSVREMDLQLYKIPGCSEEFRLDPVCNLELSLEIRCFHCNSNAHKY